MKTKKATLMLFAALCVPCLATVTIQFEFDSLRDSSGTPLSSSTAFILVADTAGSQVLPTEEEVSGVQLSVGQTVGTATIFFAGLTNGAIADGSSGVLDLTIYGVTSGDMWSILWFPGIATIGATVSNGQEFGMFQSSTLDPYVVSEYGADTAMVFPSDGTTVKTLFYDSTTAATTLPTPAQFSANFTAIPEPSTLTLSALASLALLRRRRA